jgi:alanine racemase
MLDITGVDAKVGDTVTIFGENPSVEELAQTLGTIPYEILTSVPRRIERVVIDSNLK